MLKKDVIPVYTLNVHAYAYISGGDRKRLFDSRGYTGGGLLVKKKGRSTRWGRKFFEM
jgi:hypothetical protein